MPAVLLMVVRHISYFCLFDWGACRENSIAKKNDWIEKKLTKTIEQFCPALDYTFWLYECFWAVYWTINTVISHKTFISICIFFFCLQNKLFFSHSRDCLWRQNTNDLAVKQKDLMFFILKYILYWCYFIANIWIIWITMFMYDANHSLEPTTLYHTWCQFSFCLSNETLYRCRALMLSSFIWIS